MSELVKILGADLTVDLLEFLLVLLVGIVIWWLIRGRQ